MQNYGHGRVEPWEAFVEDLEALPAEFVSIGINDYLFLDGYREVLRQRRSNRLQNIYLFLPVIELRLNHFGGTENHLSRVNLHVIFSDELDADVIQSQFINGLKCDLTLTPQVSGVPEWASLVTRDSLSALGAACKAAMPDDQRAVAASDLQEGFNNFNVSLESVLTLLENPIFRNRYFLAVGKTEWADVKWTKQSAAFKRTLINRPHFVFTAAPTPADFVRARTALVDAGVNAHLLDCSDAHSLSTSRDPNRVGNSLTWINAAPTFEGLRHAYYEYDTRVYVGDAPPKLEATRAHPTQHVERVSIGLVAGQSATPSFQNEIPLNPGFVAIVGNKGRGKSALTDIIGLLGNSRRHTHYSFLTKSRFRDPKHNLAARHEATLTWLSGASVTRGLDDECDESSTELVQYLPQSFLESVCNEGPGADKLFSDELAQVIFSHVPEADRLGAGTLNDLVASRTSATLHRIDILRGELSATVAQVLELENQLDPQARRLLENMIRDKEQELSAHDALRPAVVEPPNQDTEAASELEGRIEQVRSDIVALETEVRDLQLRANEKSRLAERARELTKELQNFDHQVETFIDRVSPMVAELGVDLSRVLVFNLNLEPVHQLTERLDGERDESTAGLSILTDGTPAKRAADARELLGDLESALDAPQRAYQSYLSALSVWEQQRAALEGSETTPGSLLFLRHQLQLLAEAPARLETLRQRRMAQALEIHSELLEVAACLRDIYRPVQTFIDEHPVVRDRFNLSFDVTIVETGLESQLFGLLNRQVSGSFAGMGEGSARLAAAVESTDFNDSASLQSFLDQLDADLQRDNRSGRGGRRTGVSEQLRKGATPQAVYELLFGLSYLTPEFWLRSDDMAISQLSPGQRGTLLLLFYLLVDRSPRPIVLDQPEENLDNQTVHELLVPAIAEARRSRQVIVVTHNPNLAVVGDADQVIVAEMTKEAFVYESGAIEDAVINERIVAILEGTWPAFENRRDKYIPTSLLDLEDPG